MGSVTVDDEELRAIGVRASVCHRQHALMRMRIPDLFILKLIAIDANAARAVASCGITTLHHEVADNAMEAVVLVAKLRAFLACTESTEILSSLRHILIKDFEDDTTFLVAIFALLANRDVEVGLYIVRLELWQGVVIHSDLGSILLVVDT